MQMYEAVWRSDGERVAVFYMSAVHEAAVLAEAKLFLEEHPDFRRSTGHLTLSIRALSSTEGLPGQQSARKTPAFSNPSAVGRERFRSKRRAARRNGSRAPRA
jgi:hypothetical protein